MIRTIALTVTLGFITAFCMLRSSHAEDAQQSFKSLIARGFKVVATVFIPGEARSDKNPVVVVTLQQDKAVAVCTVSVGGWQNLSKQTQETPTAATFASIEKLGYRN